MIGVFSRSSDGKKVGWFDNVETRRRLAFRLCKSVSKENNTCLFINLLLI